MDAHSSVVKVKSLCSGAAGIDYSDGPTAIAWTSGSTSTDSCVVQYTTLSDNSVTITALAIDGADNLWVWPALCMLRLSCQ